MILKHWAGQNMWIKPQRLVCMKIMTSIMSTSIVLLLFVCSGLTSFSTIFSHITTVSGCDRELSAHFHCAGSLKYHDLDTWHDTTPGHIILTLPRPVLALPRKSSATRGAVSTSLKDFCISRPGIEPVTSSSPKRTLYGASGAGTSLCAHKDIVHACASCLRLEIMFRCPRSVKMLHNVKKNNIDLFEVHVHASSFQIHVQVQLQINLKCTDARPPVIWS